MKRTCSRWWDTHWEHIDTTHTSYFIGSKIDPWTPDPYPPIPRLPPLTPPYPPYPPYLRCKIAPYPPYPPVPVPPLPPRTRTPPYPPYPWKFLPPQCFARTGGAQHRNPREKIMVILNHDFIPQDGNPTHQSENREFPTTYRDFSPQICKKKSRFSKIGDFLKLQVKPTCSRW